MALTQSGFPTDRPYVSDAGNFIVPSGISAETDGPSLAATEDLGGTGAGSAQSVHRFTKMVTGIANAQATAVLTVTVPNAAHAAIVSVSLLASLGTGGAVGALEASAVAKGAVILARTAGVATVATAGALTSASSAAVAGATTIALAYAVSGMTGANSATQTFTITVTITRGGGSSDNHVCLVECSVLNCAGAGVTAA